MYTLWEIPENLQFNIIKFDDPESLQCLGAMMLHHLGRSMESDLCVFIAVSVFADQDALQNTV